MRCILVLAALALLAAAPLRAQTADTTAAVPDTAALRTLVSRVCPGAPVMVTVDGRQRGPAICTTLPGSRLRVDLGEEELTPRLVEIEELWVRGRNTRRGATVGAAVGVLVLAPALGYFAYALCDHGNCEREVPNIVVASTLVGGTTGGVIGGAIGYLSKVWKRRYTASP